MRIAVLSGRYPSSKFRSAENHKAYCMMHGYTYIHANWPTGAKNPYMNKLKYIQEYYNLFDYVFWIDDDAFFIDLNVKLESLIPGEEKFLAACKSPDNKNIHTYLSSGQFLLRCNKVGRDFIDEAYLVNLDDVRTWWGDAPYDLGFFSNGDQDAMIYLLLEKDVYKNGVELHNYRKFNCRLAELRTCKATPVFVLHFTGKQKNKFKDYGEAQKILQRGPELLAERELVKLGITPRQSLLKRVFRRIPWNRVKGSK